MKRSKREESIATHNVNAFELVFGLGSDGSMDEWLRDNRTRTNVRTDVP
jgi:hypothetical protein